VTPIELLISKLSDAKPHGREWKARCPSHADKRPSLSVTEGADGRALVHCHAGCKPEEIVAAVGLKMADLMPAKDDPAPKRKKAPAGKPKAMNNATPLYATAKEAVAALEDRRGKTSNRWTYRDADGEPVGLVLRWTKKNLDPTKKDEKDILPVSKVDGGWANKAMPEPRPLYRLPDLIDRPGETVYVCEGEKAADAAAGLGLLATTSTGGAKAAGKTDWAALAGREVIILPDADEPGEKYAADVAAILGRLTPPAAVRIVRLRDAWAEIHEGGDMADVVEAGENAAEIKMKLAGLANAADPEDPPQQADESDDEPENKITQSALLVGLAKDIELFHDDRAAYATIPVGGEPLGGGIMSTERSPIHHETHPIKSNGFREWLARKFYKMYSKVPGGQAMQDALGVLIGKAKFDGAYIPVHVRLASVDGAIYLDLCDERWRVVRIDRRGWDVVGDPPIKFIRKRGMRPLPEPRPGGSISDLRPLVNLPDDRAWCLAIAWLVGVFHPTGPYAALSVTGEQGSGKSGVCRLLRDLVDSNASPVRSAPKDERDLMIAAGNSWIVAFDNLSGIAPSLSDSLCRLATGGGFATRELYSDEDEILFDSKRPIMFNGIEDLANRPDLMDRTLCIHLLPIPDNQRRTEAKLRAAFEPIRPGVLGAILDAVASALANADGVELLNAPRMADFATWVVAAEPALPWEPGTFEAVYAENRGQTVIDAIEASPVGPPVNRLMDQCPNGWSGTLGELLARLGDDDFSSVVDRQRRDWPRTPQGLSAALRRIAPALRKQKINIRQGNRVGHDRQRITVLEWVRETSSASAASSANADSEPKTGFGADDLLSSADGTSSANVRMLSAKNRIGDSKTRVADNADNADDHSPSGPKPLSNGDNSSGDWGEL
jgi:hypothetical protein